jgi:hypothetical protein
MTRKSTHFVLALAWLAFLVAPPARQSAAAGTPSPEHTMGKPRAPKLTETQKIALAMSAGPAAIAKRAAIVDMTDMSSAQHAQLRAGTNGWVCYAMIGEPMCLDKEWQKWFDAWTSHSEVKFDTTGVGYMLRGDRGASNTDPYATGPTADNHWVIAPPHLMVLFPDPKMLDAYPTDPASGGPWVMWKGTPYAHLMVPVSPTKAARMPSQ